MRKPGRVSIVFLAIFFLNCGGVPIKRGSAASTVAVGAKDRIFVSEPDLADTVEASLSALGWEGGRFKAELRKEIVYQYQRKGAIAVEDSIAAAAWLSVRLDTYGTGPDGFGYLGGGCLRKSLDERDFTFGKSKARVPERQDPTVDNIRVIAESVVNQTWKSRTAARKEREVPTQMRMMF
jgi:hypothetical protein